MTIDQTTGLYGPYGLWRQPFFQQSWFFLVLGSIAALIIFILLFFLFRFIQKKRVKQRTPVQQAIHNLEVVTEQLKNDAVSVALVGQSVTDILRLYVQRQTGRPTAHYTLSELADSLRVILVDATQQEVERLFMHAQELFFALKSEHNNKQLGEDMIRITRELLMAERARELETLKKKQFDATSSEIE